MELADAVTLFSTEVFADAFDSETTFLGKVNPFAEITNSGVSAQRRILETPIDQVMPASLAVRAMTSGETFIVAAQHADYWNGEEIRYKYSITPVSGLCAAGDIGETLLSTQPDKAIYAFPFFVRREIDEDEMSDYFSGYEIYMPRIKNFTRGTILKHGDQYFRFKTDTWICGAGYSNCQAVLIEDPIQTFDITTFDITTEATYNPVTDSYTGTVHEDITCFVEPLRQDYEFVSPSFEAVEVGDRAISIIDATLTLSVGDMIGDYRVVTSRSEGTWTTYQCRSLS